MINIHHRTKCFKKRLCWNKYLLHCGHIHTHTHAYTPTPTPIYIYVFTNPSVRAGYDRSIFKRSLMGLNSEFSFSQTSCLTKAEWPSLPYYLPIAGGRIIGFIPFPRVLVLCEMQSVSSRIWTRVAMSISYDDSHYTTGTSIYIYIWLLFTRNRYWQPICLFL